VDILNIGGFSDQVFELISAFASGDWRRTTGSRVSKPLLFEAKGADVF